LNSLYTNTVIWPSRYVGPSVHSAVNSYFGVRMLLFFLVY